ncbi:MAG: helix-turn-helix transcriptional regulator [Candidatus Aenigmatarchaeota archaeon]|jgi:uncharacterized membrane protein
MKLGRKIILVFGAILSGFIFAVSFATLYAQTQIIEGKACSCTLPIPLLIPMFSSFGILIGLISFYIFSQHFTKGENKDFSLLLKIFEPSESLVIKMLIENDGKITQSKISRNIGKVNSYRVIEKLIKRGIITKEKYGKTNIIKLKEEFRKILVS